MPISSWLAFAVAAVLPLAVSAEQAQPDPADAQANVPAYLYQSSLRQYRAAAADTETPDAAWISANRALTSQDEHAMHGPHSGQTKAITNEGPPAQAVDMHAGHHGHDREGH